MKVRTCPATGKRAHRHYQQAARDMARARKGLGVVAVDAPQSIYRCHHCGMWHATGWTQAAWKARGA